jgi:cytochrome b
LFFRYVVDIFSFQKQTLTASGRSRVRAINELHTERAQLEMQMVVAHVAAAAAMAREATTRTTLEAAKLKGI